MTTANYQILNFPELDFGKLFFAEPVKTPGGSYLCKTNYSAEPQPTPLMFQTASLRCGNIQLSPKTANFIELELSGDSSLEFYDFISKLEEKAVLTAHQNSKKWFQQEFSLEILDDFFRTLIRPKRGNKPPGIKVKIPTQRGIPVTQVYNSQRDRVELKQIQPKDSLICIIQLIGLRFLKQTFTCELQVNQIKILSEKVQPVNQFGYLFLEENARASQQPQEVQVEVTTKVSPPEQEVPPVSQSVENTSQTESQEKEDSPKELGNEATEIANSTEAESIETDGAIKMCYPDDEIYPEDLLKTEEDLTDTLNEIDSLPVIDFEELRLTSQKNQELERKKQEREQRKQSMIQKRRKKLEDEMKKTEQAENQASQKRKYVNTLKEKQSKLELDSYEFQTDDEKEDTEPEASLS